MPDTKRILSLAGLCRRAGGVIPGADSVLTSMRQTGAKYPSVIFLSDAASDRTKKQITDKASHYEIPLAVIDADPDTVGRALGLYSPCAVFGVTKKGPYEKLVEAACESDDAGSVEDHIVNED